MPESTSESYNVLKYIIGASCIKYDVLTRIINRAEKGVSKFVFHIDMDAILYRLYRERNLEAISNMDNDMFRIDFVVGVLNVLAHYRRFMSKYLRVDNAINIYWTNSKPIMNRQLIETYGDIKWKDNRKFNYIKNNVNKAMDLLADVIVYCPDIHFINTGEICQYAAIQNRIDMDFLGSHHMVFTRNLIADQIVAPNTSIMHSARDKSYILYYDDFNNYLASITKNKKDYNLDPKVIPMIYALGGLIDMGIPHSPVVRGYGRALKLVQQIWDNSITESEAISTLSSPDKTVDALRDVVGASKLPLLTEEFKLELGMHYMAVNTRFGSMAMPVSAVVNVESQIYNRVDVNMMQSLNQTLMDIDVDTQLISVDVLMMSGGVVTIW